MSLDFALLFVPNPSLREMSLLCDTDGKSRTTLQVLWREAHTAVASEPESRSFWRHLIAKHEFPEECWVCDAGMRTAPGSGKRVDQGVRFIDSSQEFMVFQWVEGKGDIREAAKEEAEEEALRACRDYLESHKSQTSIYALTTVKTEAKAWIYHRDEAGLQSLHDEHYIEANSSEGTQLRHVFMTMKNTTTGVVAGVSSQLGTS